MSTAKKTTTLAAPAARWRSIVGYLGGALLGLVFLVAAWAKTLDPAAFSAQIEREGLAFWLPAVVVALIALALEVGLGSALVLGLRRLWVLVPVTLLVIFFVFLTGRAYYRFTQGEVVDEGCGCFGNLVDRTPAEAFWQDLAVMAPALVLAWWARGRARALPRLRLGVVGVLTAATVLVAWKAPELPLDDLATRLKPGADALSFCAGRAEDGNRICLDALVPELGHGEHLVILTELGDSLSAAEVARINEYVWAAQGPRLWVLASASPEELFAFKWQRAPAFEVREVPAALLRPLYRTLPRSFLTRDGVVLATYPGLPPQLPVAVVAAAEKESQLVDLGASDSSTAQKEPSP